MEAYQRRCARHGGGANHQYSLEQFGLTTGQVRDELDDYASAYGVAAAG